MSTSAETTRQERKPVPVYKRRRRRIYAAAALALAVITGVVAWATTGGSSGPTWPLPATLMPTSFAAYTRMRIG